MATSISILGPRRRAGLLLLRALSPIVALHLPWIRTASYLAHVYRTGGGGDKPARARFAPMLGPKVALDEWAMALATFAAIPARDAIIRNHNEISLAVQRQPPLVRSGARGAGTAARGFCEARAGWSRGGVTAGAISHGGCVIWRRPRTASKRQSPSARREDRFFVVTSLRFAKALSPEVRLPRRRGLGKRPRVT
jgi:hypothetical protein